MAMVVRTGKQENFAKSGKKKTFALEMNGIEIKTLEDLRENFNLKKAVEYFKSGELVDWLADRFYDDEADAIENISADDKNSSQKICAALDVECDEDLEFTQRVREKKKILAEKTDDENIIDNATTTALNQDDLANLLHMDYPTIYLCGENFTVPIRVENKKYIGVLSTPKIKIKANSDEELEAKNIVFENCKLAWRKESPIEELKALVQRIFRNNGEFPIMRNGEKVSNYNQLDKAEKALVLRMVCQGKYREDQIAYLQVTEDLSSGFAFTIDSFCLGGNIRNNIVEYKKIESAWGMDYKDQILYIDATGIGQIVLTSDSDYNGRCNTEDCGQLFGDSLEENSTYEKIEKLLEVVKNF